MHLWRICSPIQWTVFSFCWWFPFQCKSFLVWCSFICLFIFFVSVAWGDISEKNTATRNVQDFTACIFFRIFMDSSLTLRLLIHFEFIFVYGVRRGLVSFCMGVCPIFHLLSRLFLPNCIFLPPLSNINRLQRCGFISGLSILFHWSMCLFLCLYHAVLITMALKYMWFDIR